MLAGGLFGTVTYSYAEPFLKQTALGTGGGKLIFSDLIGIPYWQAALAAGEMASMALGFGAGLRWLLSGVRRTSRGANS